MKPHEKAIVEFVRSRGGQPVHGVEIQKHLGLSKRDSSALRKDLRRMVRAGLLLRGKNRTFRVDSREEEALGKLSVARDGYGFVALVDKEGPDVFIPAHDLNGGCNGDMVRIRLTRESRGRRVGVISKIEKRKQERATGVLRKGRSGLYVDATYGAIPIRVFLEEWTEARPGDVVGVEITHYPKDSRDEYVGIVTESFDDEARVTAEIDRLVYARDLPSTFPPEVSAQANGLPEEVNEEDKGGNRKDWRDLPFVTIDGEDARDFDDAVCLVPHGKGRRLYVAVADVSHYVQEGSPLDQEARQRGTSIYFPDRVIPMLPERLSNGLCSLNPHVDRLVMAVWFDLRNDGSIGKSGVEEAVIHSHARLTYTQVARLLNGEEGEQPPEEFHSMIRDLADVSERLYKKRVGAGALDLEVPEAGFSISEDGARVESVQTRTRTDATGLIEECMLLANRTVAQRFIDAEIPSAFRVHEDPDAEKIRSFFRSAGIHLENDTEYTGADIQGALRRVDDPDRRLVLQGLLLRALQKARYTPECLGHFGLAFHAYLHFTSPIRRYPDLLVHRLARAYLLPGKRKPEEVDGLFEKLSELTTEASSLERRALECERTVADALKAGFMEEYEGEEFVGMVTSMIPRGLFIRLGDYPIDGFLPVDELPSANFEMDTENMRLVESGTNEAIGLGRKIRVVVARSSMQDRRIDLVLTDEGLARVEPDSVNG